MSIKFYNGYSMPMVGLGCSVLPEPPETAEKMADSALTIGYRHFDTAPTYKTEIYLGNAIKKAVESGIVDRKDLFVVTKLPQTAMRPERVARFMDKSLTNLQLDYVDLYLIHWPFGLQYTNDNVNVKIPTDCDGKSLLDMESDFESVWKEMEKLVEYGLTKSIGLSNFNQTQIEKILKICKIRPMCNQIELNAAIQQPELREFCQREGIAVTAYFPLGGPNRKDCPPDKQQVVELPNLLEDSLVLDMAKKYNRTPGQILLRFLTQLDVAVIPKCSKPSHQRENLSIMDFHIEDSDMTLLKGLDKGESGRTCLHFPGCEQHPDYPFGQKEEASYCQRIM